VFKAIHILGSLENAFIRTAHQMLLGWSNREEWDGRECSTYGGGG